MKFQFTTKAEQKIGIIINYGTNLPEITLSIILNNLIPEKQIPCYN